MSLPFSPGRSDRVAIGDLIRDLFLKISDLISTQVELTKTEIKVESRKLVVAAAYGMAALIIGSVFVLFLAISMTLAIGQAVGLVWASVITTVVFLALAGIATGLMVSELRKKSARIDVD